MRRSTFVLTTLLVLLAGRGAAQTPPPPCDADSAFHALDFWVGEWSVQIQGREVGRNRIEKILRGCAIVEYWEAGDGSRGQSLFYYLPALAEWRQVWVTENARAGGGVKEKRLTEQLPGGAVRFQGTIPLAGGRSYLDRTTLTPMAGGNVRQHIEYSTDGGASWQTSFDAVYVRH